MSVGCYDGRGNEHYAENGLIENHTMLLMLLLSLFIIVSIDLVL